MGDSDVRSLLKSTLERYKVQVELLEAMEKEIDTATVTKEYVKGRQNTFVNPAISAYCKMAVAANGTLTTLLKLLQRLETDKDVLPSFGKLHDFREFG